MEDIHMFRRLTWRCRAAIAFSALFAFLIAPSGAAQVLSAGVPHATPGPGLMFTATNAAAGNKVVVFRRAPEGTITQAQSISTGGLGSGDELASQGSMLLSGDARFLLVVNAGSNDITVFRVEGGQLTLTDREPSQGGRPISVTMSNGLVYVLNGGSPNSLMGFNLSANGQLVPAAGSARSLNEIQAGPAEIGISPDGNWLVVTEKMTNLIDVFPIQANGQLGRENSQPSSGVTPFGFAFHFGQLIVSEAFANSPGAGAVSSYSIGANGTLTTISASAPTHQTASCWIALPEGQAWTYTTNTGSQSATGFRVSAGGALDILDVSGVTTKTGKQPTDVTFAQHTRFMYVLDSGDGTISGYELTSNGALKPLNVAGSLPPATVAGLVGF
jgi:6-phosphogluconolactonase (cycloisomerase 2 family)